MFICTSYINLNVRLSLYVHTHLYIFCRIFWSKHCSDGMSRSHLELWLHLQPAGINCTEYIGRAMLLRLLAPSCRSQWFPSSWRGNCPPRVTPVWASEKRKPHNTELIRSSSEQLASAPAPQLPSPCMPCSCVGSIIHLMLLRCGAPFPSQQVVSLSHRDKAALERTQTDGSCLKIHAGRRSLGKATRTRQENGLHFAANKLKS